MQEYELVSIVAPTVPDEELPARLERISNLVTGAGGEVMKVTPWGGRRRLAYEIDRHREGIYVTHDFRGPTRSVAEINRGMSIMDDVIRHIIMRKPAPKAPKLPRRLKRQPAQAASAG